MFDSTYKDRVLRLLYVALRSPIDAKCKDSGLKIKDPHPYFFFYTVFDAARVNINKVWVSRPLLKHQRVNTLLVKGFGS